MLSDKSVPDKRSTDGKSLLQHIGKSFSDHSFRISPFGDRVPGLAHHHGLALAPTWCGTGPGRTP